MVDPNNPADMDEVHKLQDAIGVTQVRGGLLALARTLPDTKRAFGPAQDTDPVRHLICSASAWGGNPEKDALYLNGTPSRNDGTTVYRLSVADVPVAPTR